MFNMSFSELMVIGVIALIVIGPERLPKVARTVGHLLGRAQRYVNDVKSDIQKEMDLKDIGDIKNQMEDAARSVQTSLTASAEEFKSAVEAPAQALKGDLEEARQALDVKSLTEPVTNPASTPALAATAPAPTPAAATAGAPTVAATTELTAETKPTVAVAPAPAAPDAPAPAAAAPTSTESSH
ncbi:MAG: twin-arginine translocase subunit TatB [Castellaniella sp.]|uniref:Sec-independent protein translocase protein TatB n=1 Tax=Castellaniella sp. TaxID=1955812 RepID=UPI00120AB3D3|nr:Sec-independent protein translocase protein TatB [Castellaniella sp.]TAN25486.1 MAG: twin-arginine translocase subunit TatB [Castellaniella sp.]